MEKFVSFLKGLSPTTWIIIAIVILIIIALIIYFSNKDKATATEDVSMNKTLDQNLGASQPRSVFPLQYGAKGAEVKVVQAYLNSKGEKLIKDGIWGPLTDASVLKVLKVNSISEDLYKTLI